MAKSTAYFTASQREIARRCGLSRATVSYALRNDPKISPQVRNRVRAAARALDYRPDPQVVKLMAHLRTARPRRSVTKVALIIPGFPATWMAHNRRMQQMLAGARAQAERHGFAFEQLWLEGEPGMTLRRLQSIVQARGIDGLVVGSMRHGSERFDFDFSRLAVAAIGYSMREPAVHRACPHHYKMMRGLLKEVRQRGFRRVGALYNQRLEDGSNNLLSSAFYYAQRDLPVAQRLPLQIEEAPTIEHVRRYLRAHRPDVMIGEGYVHQFLTELGLRVPEDISFASIDRGDPPYDAAGIDGHYDLVAATAVDMVATQITLNQRGLPDVPKVMMVDSEWSPGATLGQPVRSVGRVRSPKRVILH